MFGSQLFGYPKAKQEMTERTEGKLGFAVNGMIRLV